MTSEGLDTANLMVKKRDGRVVGFSSKRLAESMQKAAVNKLPRDEVADLVSHVVEELFAADQLFFDKSVQDKWTESKRITTRDIGDAVMRVLDSKPTYRATRMRYGLLFGRSHGTFTDAATFLEWLEQDQKLPPIKLPSTPKRVVKRSGLTQDFRPQNLYDSIKFSVRKRPVDEEQEPGARRTNEELILALYRLILEHVRGQQVVTSTQLAMATIWVLLASKDEELEELMTPGDRQLAYLRVVSSAKRFTQAEDFQAEATLLVSQVLGTVPSGLEEHPNPTGSATGDVSGHTRKAPASDAEGTISRRRSRDSGEGLSPSLESSAPHGARESRLR
jgi:transcriptional regulator NrdR family protein